MYCWCRAVRPCRLETACDDRELQLIKSSSTDTSRQRQLHSTISSPFAGGQHQLLTHGHSYSEDDDADDYLQQVRVQGWNCQGGGGRLNPPSSCLQTLIC